MANLNDFSKITFNICFIQRSSLSGQLFTFWFTTRYGTATFSYFVFCRIFCFHKIYHQKYKLATTLNNTDTEKNFIFAYYAIRL